MAKKSMIMEKDLSDALSWIGKKFKKRGKFEITYEEKRYLISNADEIFENPGVHVLLIFKNEKEEVKVDIRNRDFSHYVTKFKVEKKKNA